MVLKVTLRDAQVSHGSISQKPSQKGTESRLGLRRATGSADLAWLLKVSALSPNPMLRERDVEEATQGEGQQRCSPSQVEVGRSRSFHQSDRSFRRPSCPSEGASHLCRDLARCPARGFGLIPESHRPLVKGRDQDLLDALRSLAEEKRQARVTHAYRVVMRFGLPIRTKAEVDRFLAWMKAEGLAASTQSTILCTIRSVQPGNEPLLSVQVKVPARSVQRRC